MRVLVKQLLTAVVAVLLFSTSLSADVKQDSETKIKIKGAVGSVMKFFGANKPVRTVTYLKGDLQRTDTFDKKRKKVVNSQIVDLNREMFITIDRKKKKYTEMTFEEWREMLNSGLASVLSQSEMEPEQTEPEQTEQTEQPETEIEMSFTVDVETPGDTEIMAGHEAEKVVVTLKVEGEGIVEKEGEEPQKVKGGMIVRSTNWIAHSAKGQDEMREFALKLVQKLGMEPGLGGLAGVVGSVMKNNEQLAAAITELQKESDKLSGVPMRVHTVFETWGQDLKPKANEPEEEEVKMPSVGGLFKKFGKKQKDKKKDNVLLETTMKVKKYETGPLSSDLFVVPSKYKLKKKK